MKSFWNILIYYIGYVTIKDLKHVKINSVNVYLICNKVNGYFEQIKGNTKETKEKFENMKNFGVKSET